MIPDKIYLPWEYSEIDVLPPGVTTKQAFGKDVCYIRKDALLEWINKARAVPHENAITRDLAFQEVVNKLNSM